MDFWDALFGNVERVGGNDLYYGDGDPSSIVTHMSGETTHERETGEYHSDGQGGDVTARSGSTEI